VQPGQIGEFTVRELVGRGGMGLVYRVASPRHPDLALKLLRSAPTDRMARLRFQREFATLVGLSHPVLVPVHDWGEFDGQPYYTMEWVQGSSLTDFLAARPEALQSVMERLLDALGYIHANWVVHRDLKPDNILVDEQAMPRLLDFGLAFVSNVSRLSDPGMILGTVHYMSPEQIRGEELDARSDLYSLGVVLYEILAGQLPFQGGGPLDVLHQILTQEAPPLKASAPVAELVGRLLAKHPADRFASAPALLTAWRQAFGQPAGPALEGPPPLYAPRFVGRTRELEQLERLLEHGGLLCLEGVSGVGKTRLLQEFEKVARSQGFSVAWGSCREGDDAPYAPWQPCLQAALGGELPPALKPFAGSLALVLPELGPVRAGSLQKLHLFEGMLRLLAGATPGLLLLDDVQWADEVSLEFLAYLARAWLAWEEEGRAPPRPRLALVAAYHSGTATPLEKLGVSRLHLEALTREESRAMALSMGGLELSEEALEQAEGNPLFISEMVRMLAEDVTAGGATLREVVARRLAGVPEAQLEVARLAALLGRSFDFGALSQVAQRSDAELLDDLEALVRRRLVRFEGGSYSFDSHAVWELLCQGGTRSEHARVARVLPEDEPERLAHHYREAGENEAAGAHLLRAAASATAAFAYARAVELYQQAEELGASDREGLGDALFGAHRTEEARAVYEGLPASPRRDRKVGTCWKRAGELELAVDHLKRALEAHGGTLASRSLSGKLRLTGQLVQQYFRPGTGLPRVERAQAEEVFAVAEHLWHVTFFLRQPGWQLDLLELTLRQQAATQLLQAKEASAQQKITATWFALTRAKPPLGRIRPSAEEAMRLTRELTPGPYKAVALRDTGYMLFLTGDLEGVWAIEEGAAMAREFGELSGESLSLAALMLAYRHTGRPERGESSARRYRELLAVTGNRVEAILVDLAQAMLEATRGEAQAARARLEAADAQWTRSPGGFLEEQREMTRAWVLVAEGRWQEALAQGALAERLLRGGENFVYLMEVRLAAAWAAVETLAPAQARRHLKKLQEGADLTPHLQTSAHYLEARLAEREGRPDAALELYGSAVESAQELECPLTEARCHLALARVLAGSSPDKALRAAAAGRKLAEVAGARPEVLG